MDKHDYLSPQEAREVALPLNPLRRIQEIRRYAGQMAVGQFGNRLPRVITRRRLVQWAEQTANADSTSAALIELRVTADRLTDFLQTWNQELTFKENEDGKNI